MPTILLPPPSEAASLMDLEDADPADRSQIQGDADAIRNRVPSAGERMVLTINDVEYAFRWCPAGTFMMGSPANEVGRDNDERQHQVTLTRGFFMLETPVTQAMWESVMGNDPSQRCGTWASSGNFWLRLRRDVVYHHVNACEKSNALS